MAEDLAKAAMYAIRAIVEGLRDSGVLTQRAIEAIEQRTTQGINAAAAIDVAGVGFPPGESRALRHGMWWARECVAPEGDSMPEMVSDHPSNPFDWPSLAERQAEDD